MINLIKKRNVNEGDMLPIYDIQHEIRRKELLKVYFSKTAQDVFN